MKEETTRLLVHYANKLSGIFLNFGEYSDEDAEKIISIGLETAKESYLAVKHDDIGSISKIEKKHLEELKNYKPELHNGDTYFYIGMCRYSGMEIAFGSPKKIDDMLKHIVRVK